MQAYDIFEGDETDQSISLRAGRAGLNSQQGKIFLFSTASRPAPGATSSLLSNGYRVCFLGGKEQECDADHSHIVPRSRKVELHLHSPIRLHGVVLN
jgi:hypothetical protein